MKRGRYLFNISFQFSINSFFVDKELSRGIVSSFVLIINIDSL